MASTSQRKYLFFSLFIQFFLYYLGTQFSVHTQTQTMDACLYSIRYIEINRILLLLLFYRTTRYGMSPLAGPHRYAVRKPTWRKIIWLKYIFRLDQYRNLAKTFISVSIYTFYMHFVHKIIEFPIALIMRM